MSVNLATLSSLTLKSVCQMNIDRVSPVKFEPYNWLKDAKIYNKKWQLIPTDWIIENTDILVLLFTAKGVDRHGILKKFYHVYESTKYAHIPIEVIFLPMDETEEDAVACFAEQANWFTLRFDDILIHTLKFMYEITCIPKLIVFKTNCEVISYDGIADLDLYDKNAVISWLTKSTATTKQRRRSEDAEMYGPVWKFVKQEENQAKYEYKRRFKSDGKPVEDRPHLPGYTYPPGGRIKLANRKSKTTKESKTPADQVQSSEGQTKTGIQSEPSEGRSKSAYIAAQFPEGRSKSPSTAAQLPELPEGRSKSPSMAAQFTEGRSKSASMAAQFPESRSKSPSMAAQFTEGRSKSAGALPSPAHSKPSIVQIQLPDEHSRTSKSVQLPDDKLSESNAPPSVSRSKSAVTHPAESNAQLKESRSKSAKFSEES